MSSKRLALLVVIILVIAVGSFIVVVRRRLPSSESDHDNKGLLPIPLWCISLEERKDRRDAFLQRMTGMTGMSSFVHIEMVPAIPRHVLVSQYFRTDAMQSMQRGALGCTLSHLSVCLRFLASPYEIGLIMEDDAVCSSSQLCAFLEMLNTDYKKSCPSHKNNNMTISSYKIFGQYDLLFLGVTNCIDRQDEPCQFLREKERNKIHSYPIRHHREFMYLWGTHAYLITKRAANAIVSQMLPIQKHYDMFLSDSQLWDRMHLSCGVVENMLCTTADATDSDTIKS